MSHAVPMAAHPSAAEEQAWALCCCVLPPGSHREDAIALILHLASELILEEMAEDVRLWRPFLSLSQANEGAA